VNALIVVVTAAAVTRTTKPQPTGWVAYLTPDHLTTFASATVAAILGALIAAKVAVAAYKAQQKEARRQERARLYAEALRAVDDYLEAPYRIMRRDGSAQARLLLTESISEIKSRISFYTGWLLINAPPEVYDAYCKYNGVAQKEAGQQMTAAWHRRPTKRDRDVPLGTALPRKDADAARKVVLEAMAHCLQQ
jgi:hypothetical protein